ncbi:MAG: hypothetical protein EOM34_06770 [Clostridia bacterium]|nr:hypothetical protein [Clostridia bacterium]NCD02752.1 hypothetical protein [Clostridia bacterium]
MQISVLLLAAGILSAGILCAFSLKKENIVKLCVLTVLIYFSLYIIISGLCFWGDVFSINRALAGVLVVTSAINVFFVLFKHTGFEMIWNIKQCLIPILIIVCALPFVLTKYEYFGMGQDEGVYQTQAISLIYGYTDIQQDFKEYTLLDSELAKADYATAMKDDLIGLYNYDTSLPFASEEKEVSDVSAVFHGIPTFPALLALSGKLFGISHMSGIQTLFYICSVFLIFFILDDLKVKKALKIVGTLLFAVSPLILWVSKSALTEIELVCLILGFIYFIMTMKKEHIYLSLIPVTAFCFFHITIYTMIPVILLLYMGLYIYQKDIRYLIVALLANTAFIAGITMTMMIAGTYSFVNNFWPLYGLPGVGQENIALTLWIAGGLVYIFCIILYLIKKYFDKIIDLCNRFKNAAIRVCLVGGILFQGYIIMTRREAYQGGINTFKHLSLTGYGLVVGILLPAVGGILAVLFTKKIFVGTKKSMIAVLFIYCIIIYSCVMRKDIAYYYYYGRYLAPYISVVILFSAVALDVVSRWAVYAMGLISLVILAPYEKMLLVNKDDTRVTWEALEKVAEHVEANSCVVIPKEDMKFYFLALRAMKGAEVFPYTEAVLEEINSENRGFYIVSGSTLPLEGGKGICETTFQLSEDNNLYDGKRIPFPLDVTKENKSVVVQYFDR